jgi:hypothetical protein
MFFRIDMPGRIKHALGDTFSEVYLSYFGRTIPAGEHFEAAFLVGYFDSIDPMRGAYDKHAGHRGLDVDAAGWRLTR